MSWFSHRRRWPRPEDNSRTKCRTLSLFVPGGLDLSHLTLTFEVGRDFYRMHVTAKFHRPTFNRLEVIVLTNKETDKQTDKQTNRRRWKHPPRSAMLRRWVTSGKCAWQNTDFESVVTALCIIKLLTSESLQNRGNLLEHLSDWCSNMQTEFDFN